MTTRELKDKYLKFFESRGHKIIPSASLIPENDPTVLFTTAGMHPLVPYLLGEKHPAGNKLVNVQKCIRTSDIDEVGDNVHLTFFEMLGNWGLGSYWKKEAIEMSWEFLFDKKWLELDKKKISVSVFAGDSDASFDEESYNLWLEKGILEKRIKKLPKKDNFWGPAGKTGPCGPCTEMFYDGVEIWNDVFMEFNKTAEGNYEPLKQRNIDTGMGVERTVVVLNNKKNVFDVEPLKSIIEKVREFAKTKDDKAERIIADHLRAATFIMGDEKGIAPSNVEQGYVVRRLIRRAIRYGKKIGINNVFSFKIAEKVIELMNNDYPELRKNKDFIIEQLIQEEERFEKILERGERIIEVSPSQSEDESIAEELFKLKTQEGMPFEMSCDKMKDKGVEINDEIIAIYNEKIKKHQKLSRTATAGKFKSGLADNSEAVTKLHTATHLLLAALRKVLGEHVFQKGSNITAERLRLDFSHPEKLTQEQLKKVEDIINEQIKKDLPIYCEEMSLEDAEKKNAMGVFENKYGEKVKVYTVGPSMGSGQVFSCEICSGPHIEKTSELGHFKILKEEASSSGVRRIKAILE